MRYCVYYQEEMCKLPCAVALVRVGVLTTTITFSGTAVTVMFFVLKVNYSPDNVIDGVFGSFDTVWSAADLHVVVATLIWTFVCN